MAQVSLLPRCCRRSCALTNARLRTFRVRRAEKNSFVMAGAAFHESRLCDVSCPACFQVMVVQYELNTNTDVRDLPNFNAQVVHRCGSMLRSKHAVSENTSVLRTFQTQCVVGTLLLGVLRRSHETGSFSEVFFIPTRHLALFMTYI